jgi:DNA-binding IclR family transcriptional regulator
MNASGRTEHEKVSDAPSGRAAAMVPAVTRALRLLDTLAERREAMGLVRLAQTLALPKSSVHGLCNTMLRLGYLRRQSDGAFLLGPRVMRLADAFIASIDVAQEFAALWKETASLPDETIILSVLSGTDVVYVGVRNGSRPLGLAFNVGMRLPAHLAATGKAMLAFHDREFVRRLFPAELQPGAPGRAPCTLDVLLAELEVIRRRGHSIDDEGIREGVYCVGAPVFDASGQPVAGVGVCVHKGRLGQEGGERQLQAVLDAARLLSARLGARASATAGAPGGRSARLPDRGHRHRGGKPAPAPGEAAVVPSGKESA